MFYTQHQTTSGGYVFSNFTRLMEIQISALSFFSFSSCRFFFFFLDLTEGKTLYVGPTSIGPLGY